MKKRILSLLLALVMLVGMIPAATLTASAASAHSILVDGVDMSDGTYLAVGASNTTTSKPSGGYAYWKDDVLTLNNFEIYGKGLISCKTSFTLYLEGTNTITRPKDFAESKTGAINCTAGSLTIDGDGVLDVTNYGDGIYTARDLVINGGILRIEGQCFFDSSTSTDYGGKSLLIDGALYINGGYVYAGGVDCSPCKAQAVYFNGGISHFLPGHKRGTSITSNGKIYETGNPIYLVRDLNSSILEQWSLSDMRSECAPDSYTSKKGVDEIIVINEIEFVDQFPEMPAGKTEHNLGKVSSSEYVMTFGSQDTPSSIGVGGYKVIEKLVVYDRDNNGKIVDTVTNNPTINGTGISYSLKNLPSGNYRIRESIILYDKDGKALYGNNNDFILEVESTVNNVNVSATFSGTPADATTNTDGITVTSTKWYKKNGSSWTQLGASDTFKEGGTYRCEVTLAAESGFALVNNYTVKINGIAATKKSGNTWYLDKTKPAFTTQPTGGTVGYNERHTVNWTTNFDAVKQELVRYSSAGSVLQTQALSAGAFQASLPYMTGGLYYRIRAYYDYYSDAYVESDKFYVTPDQYFTPNNQHGNEEGDIITGITYVPNGDGTFNANVHVDLSYVDGQMLIWYWGSTGYYWYDHNNKLTYGIGTTDTSELVFTLYNVGENLEPGKEWKVKVYLADDPYADYEWREVDFPYVTDTVPELKPEDAFTPAFTNQPVGGKVAKGEKLTVSWATNFTPKKLQVLKYSKGYCTGAQNLDVNATTANLGAGDEYCIIRAYYSDTGYVDSNKFTVTEVTSDVLLGDINGDGEVNAKDSNLLKQMLSGSIEFPAGSRENLAADINGDGEISAKDSNLIKQIISGL